MPEFFGERWKLSCAGLDLKIDRFDLPSVSNWRYWLSLKLLGLGMNPVIEADLACHVRTMEELVELLEA
jgi:hypothetical protein